MSWYPHVTVATVVEKDGKFLMVREIDNGKTVINQPAGHLERNESLVQAAVRETLEETRWVVQPTYVLSISQYHSPNNNTTYVRITFVAEPLAEHPEAMLDADILDAVWMSYEEILASLDSIRSPMVVLDIENHLRGQRYPLDLVQFVK